MRAHFLAVALFFAVLFNAAAHAFGAPLLNIPLKWTPTSHLAEMGSLDISGSLLTIKIYSDTLVDSRQNPALLAENRKTGRQVAAGHHLERRGRFRHRPS